MQETGDSFQAPSLNSRTLTGSRLESDLAGILRGILEIQNPPLSRGFCCFGAAYRVLECPLLPAETETKRKPARNMGLECEFYMHRPSCFSVYSY